MNVGKVFEKSFANSIPKDIYYMRIKDSSNFHKANKNPFDCFILYNGYFIPIELKSIGGKSISFQINEDEKGKDIQLHQINNLIKASKENNVVAGFIFNFRQYETYWIDINDFVRFMNGTSKKSINISDVTQNNGILIDKKLMKVNYKYDIKKLLDCITKKG